MNLNSLRPLLGRLLFPSLVLLSTLGPVRATIGPVRAAQTSVPGETKAARDARMKWWREAKFGLFIHWGVYSVPAGSWQGKPVAGIGEWIMNRGKIPVADYQAFAQQFTAEDFDAEEWVSLAKEAGMKYIVITAKHHDGFAMFETKASPWNIVQASPFKRDPLKDLAAACRKHGIKLGFYYSQDQDWCNGGSAIGGLWDATQSKDFDGYINRVAVPQVRELLSHYGEFPAVLWWDTPNQINRAQATKLHRAVQELKPGLIMNNRLGGGFDGDTETPEQFIPTNGYPGKDWETCMTMNDTWGFKKDDHKWKSTAMLVSHLCECLSKGGNFLLNVGPTSTGVIPYPSRERLREVGAWIRRHQAAVEGVRTGPLGYTPDWGFASQNDQAIYLYVTKWPKNGQLEVPLLNASGQAHLLLEPKHNLSVTRNDKGLVVNVPTEAPEDLVNVVVLTLDGAPKPAPKPPVLPVAQSAEGTIQLGALQGELVGDKLRAYRQGEVEAIRFWTNLKDYVRWNVVVKTPGTFTVRARYGVSPERAGSVFGVQVGRSTLTTTLASTGEWEHYQDLTLGQVTLTKTGQQEIRAVVKKIANGAALNLESLTLIPVNPAKN